MICREFRHLPQTAYDRGDLMCTSASVCMAVAIVTGKVGTLLGHANFNVAASIPAVMKVASCAQKIVEDDIAAGRREKQETAKKGRHGISFKGNSIGRMISVKEMIARIGMVADDMGVYYEEYIICPRGMRTRLKFSSGSSGDGDIVRKRDESKPKNPLKYECETVFIHLRHLPDLLIHSVYEKPAACVLTSNGHSICVGCQKGQYCFFDSQPSRMVVGLTSDEMMEMVLNSRFPGGLKEGMGSGSITGGGQQTQCDVTVISLY